MSDDGDLKMYFDFQKNIIIYLKISLQCQCKNESVFLYHRIIYYTKILTTNNNIINIIINNSLISKNVKCKPKYKYKQYLLCISTKQKCKDFYIFYNLHNLFNLMNF